MSNEQQNETYYTVAEVAWKLKVSTKTVRRWINMGIIRADRFGRLWRVPATEVGATEHVGSEKIE